MLTVALDTGPLYGAVTGVGRTVIEILSEFERRSDDLTILPYALSLRAPLTRGTHRLTFPAGPTLRCWSHVDFPRFDGTLSGAQVIHGTNYVVPPSRLPRLVTVNDCWALRHPEHCSPAVNLSMRVLRRSIAAGVHVHAPSRATAAAVHEFFPSAPVTVVPWATPRIHDIPARRPRVLPRSDDTPFVLAVGTIDQRKNLVRLVTAFGAVATEFGDLHLVVAGARGNAAASVEATIGALPQTVRQRIRLVHGLAPDEISWLYRAATVLAYPSLDEGFGFPLLEAMAAGTPVVAANSGSLPEIADRAAVLVDPYDTDALAGALALVVRDEGRRSELVAAGHRRVQDFSWSTTADGLLDLYRLVAASTGSHRKSERRPQE